MRHVFLLLTAVILTVPGARGIADTARDPIRADVPPLLQAVEAGRLAEVQRLLAAGADLTATNNFGFTALHVAAVRGRSDMVKVLLAAGADLTATNIFGWMPLHVLARNGQLDTVRVLLAAGADVNARDREKNGWPALPFAIEWGHADVVAFLLAAGAKYKDALYYTASQGHADVVAVLLATGADVHARNTIGWTPLHSATGNLRTSGNEVYARNGRNTIGWRLLPNATGNANVATLLLDAGAEVDARIVPDKTEANEIDMLIAGLTPLQLAACNTSADIDNCAGIVPVLLAAGADPTATAPYGWMALHWAARQGCADMVALLLAAGTEPTAMNVHGWTPLHLAAYNGHADAVVALLTAGADPTATTNAGQTALHMADAEGHADVAAVLWHAERRGLLEESPNAPPPSPAKP